MKNKMVTIYKRNNGEIFLHAYNQTTMGVALACPPFLSFDSNDISGLKEQIMELLRKETRVVPHPNKFNQLDDLYSLAGCRDWKTFAAKTSCFHAQLQENQIILIPTEKDGAGFKDLAENIRTCEEGNLAVYLEQLIR